MEEFMTSMRGYDKIPAVQRAIDAWEKLARNERNSKNKENFNQHATNLQNQKLKFLRKVQTISNNIKNDPKIDKDTKEQFFIDLYKLKRNSNQELSKNAFQNLLDEYSLILGTDEYSKANKEHKIVDSLKNGSLNTIAGKNNIALTGITKGILTTAAISAFSYMNIGGTTVNAIKVIPWIIKSAWMINPALGICAGALLAVGTAKLLNKVFGKEAKAALRNLETKKKFVNNLEMPENEADFDNELKEVYEKKEEENKNFFDAEKAKKTAELEAEILSAPALKGNRTDYKSDDFYKEINGLSSYMDLCARYGNYLTEDEVKNILESTINTLNTNNQTKKNEKADRKKQANIDNLDKALKGTNATDKATYEALYNEFIDKGLSKEDIEKVFADNNATLPENWSKELVNDADVKKTVQSGNYTKFIADYKAAMTDLLNGTVSKVQANIKLQQLKEASKLKGKSKDVAKTKELFDTMIEVYENLSQKSAEILKDQKTKDELKAKGLDATTLDNLIK